MNEFRAILDDVKHPYPLVFVTVSGAHLYGFASDDSDVDLRGVYALGPEGIAGLDKGPYTHEFEGVRHGREIDLVTHDIEKFIGMMLKRNGYVLEQLWSPLVVHTSRVHQRMKDLSTGCITRHHAHHYLGFSRNQWSLFLKDDPPRVKPLLYVYRVLLTGIHMMQTGEVEANLPSLNRRFGLTYIDELVARKTEGCERETIGKADLQFHEKEFLRLTAELERAGDQTSLPELPTTRAKLNDLLLDVRLNRQNHNRG